MALKLNGTNSVAAPAYAGADADTGLQCGTDEVNLVTGGTARLKIDSSGNVGIGTSSPSRKLHIVPSGSNAYDAVQIGDGLYVGNTSNNNNAAVFHQGGGADLEIGSQQHITFTTGDIAGSATERLRIDSSGNVGIGNSSPSNYSSTGRNLVVGTGSSAAGLTVASGATNTGNIYFAAGSTGDDQVRGQIRYNHSTEAMDLYTDASLRMRIDSSGNVGIATSTISGANLVIATNSNSGSGIKLIGKSANGGAEIDFRNNADSTLNGFIEFNDNGGILSTAINQPQVFRTNNTERMRITSSGNVGINNAAPADKLHVGGNIRFGTNTTYYGIIEHDAAVTGANIYTSKDTGGHIFKTTTSPSESLRLTNDGKLRIKMNDFGNDPSASNSGLQLFDTSGGAITSSASVTTGSSHAVFLNPNGVCGTIQTSGSATSYNTSSDYRLKENVVDLDGAITRVKQLAPKRFNFISNAATTVDGFLAHEAQTVVPEAVTGTHNQVQVWDESEELPEGVSVGDNKLDEDGNTIPEYQGIDQSKLVPLLTAALQEAISKIETLETQNADLLARVTALEAA